MSWRASLHYLSASVQAEVVAEMVPLAEVVAEVVEMFPLAEGVAEVVEMVPLNWKS